LLEGPERPEEVDALSEMYDVDGTFEVYVRDDKQDVRFILSCCWDTSVSDILDVVTPLRKYEFPNCENLICSREKVTLGFTLHARMSDHQREHHYIQLPENATLGDIGYRERYSFTIVESRIISSHPLVTARMESYAKGREFPDGNFAVRIFDFSGLRPGMRVFNVNKATTLDKIVQRLKVGIRQSGVENADWYGREDEEIAVFGLKDFAIWDHKSTTLGDLCCQGNVNLKEEDGGVLYYL
jgi:hypothetical protein